MGCKRYLKYLHLNGQDELSHKQQLKLKRHLSRCPDCRQQQKQINRIDPFIHQARDYQPQMAAPINLQVIQAIQSIREGKRLKNDLAPITLRPAFSIIRAFLAFGVIAILVFFSLQTVILLNHIGKLEEQMNRFSVKPETSGDLPARIFFHQTRQTLLWQNIQEILSQSEFAGTDRPIQEQIMTFLTGLNSEELSLLQKILSRPRLIKKMALLILRQSKDLAGLLKNKEQIRTMINKI